MSHFDRVRPDGVGLLTLQVRVGAGIGWDRRSPACPREVRVRSRMGRSDMSEVHDPTSSPPANDHRIHGPVLALEFVWGWAAACRPCGSGSAPTQRLAGSMPWGADRQGQGVEGRVGRRLLVMLVGLGLLSAALVALGPSSGEVFAATSPVGPLHTGTDGSSTTQRIGPCVSSGSTGREQSTGGEATRRRPPRCAG